MSQPRVEILFFPGCPSYRRACELVRRVAADLGLDVDIALVEVSDVDAADELRFLGSPTVRVEGRDVEPGADERGDYAFACRVYRDRTGVAAIPNEAWVEEALRNAA